MKNMDKLYKEIRKYLKSVTTYEKTRILVEVDRILTTPYRDHRVELLMYSVRYNARNKTIYIYKKKERSEIVDEHEYLTDPDTNFEGYDYKISIITKILKH